MEKKNIDFIKGWAAFALVKNFDLDNHKIIITLDKGMTEELMMEKGMMGEWLIEHRFNISFEVKDVEYTTKPTFEPHSCTTYRGHKAYLRNRTVLTITW